MATLRSMVGSPNLANHPMSYEARDGAPCLFVSHYDVHAQGLQLFPTRPGAHQRWPPPTVTDCFPEGHRTSLSTILRVCLARPRVSAALVPSRGDGSVAAYEYRGTSWRRAIALVTGQMRLARLEHAGAAQSNSDFEQILLSLGDDARDDAGDDARDDRTNHRR